MKKLYFLLAVLLFGLKGNSQHAYISYPNPICPSYMGMVNVTLTGDGNYLGGTFSSLPGLVINSSTGTIDSSNSTPGNYVVTYSVPPSLPDNIAITCTILVSIAPISVPIFSTIPPVCLGSNPPLLPSVSNNGISGTWTPSTVSNQYSGVYTFTPEGSECATTVTMLIPVFSPYVPVITTESGLNTLYVDDNNNVVAPLELISGQPDGYSFQWSEDTSFIIGATNTNYVVDTASPTGDTRFYRVWVTDIETGCSTVSSQFAVVQSNGVPPPHAPRYQNLAPGSTLADVVVSGSGIRWYAAAVGKAINTTELPLTTMLSDNTTYYASQTVNGNESVERQPVTVHLTLGVVDSDLVSVDYSPNPVKSNLTIKSSNTIDAISIMNILGQTIKKATYNQSEIVIDMNDFRTGTYFVRINSADRAKVFKVIKE
ncbi:MAG TPA: T9SS type A sorting domain-containing protein [Flavobacterium sp.]|uniref:T9SS type A sorting domain-containing protein n=1 Tax=Flavobacterium sp. TaxID=239 RepID=UPI002C8261F0|nr:T9SS type A sorting domain-containing protein [Flavobacterium sp.]HNP32820.1 T9SS type A sorting domain-containing protein [Flavobacterium sp.]